MFLQFKAQAEIRLWVEIHVELHIISLSCPSLLCFNSLPHVKGTCQALFRQWHLQYLALCSGDSELLLDDVIP